MKRFLPRSLIGQIALVMALVLLVVQAVNFMAVRSERQQLSQALLEGPVISRFVAAGTRMIERGRRRPIENRRGRIALSDTSAVPAGASDARLARRLQETAAANGLPVQQTRAAVSDRLPARAARRLNRSAEDPMMRQIRPDRFRSLLLSIQLPDGRWLNGQLLIPRPDRWAYARLALTTLLFYLFLLGALIAVLARLIRPLRDLTQAAQRYQGHGEAPHVAPSGPADIRRAIEAFNAMGARVRAMLDEKDRMLGAIGHDLRTPLASLRIRAENVEASEERERMIATIEEMAQLLDQTLALARSGRSNEPVRALDIAALADAVVEEFRELGCDVALEESPRVVANVRPNLLRGAIRNLVDNAVKYAGAARLSVGANSHQLWVDVQDRGPGIPEAHLHAVQEAFVRLEASRNRQTGGSGLGITLARAAALSHGGELRLENRAGGGLCARLLLPKTEGAT